jgi:hypothetical protein
LDEYRLLLKESKKCAMIRLNRYQDDAALGRQEQQTRGIKIAETRKKALPLQRWRVALEPHGEKRSRRMA